MDPTVIAAIISAIGTITAALIQTRGKDKGEEKRHHYRDSVTSSAKRKANPYLLFLYTVAGATLFLVGTMATFGGIINLIDATIFPRILGGNPESLGSILITFLVGIPALWSGLIFARKVKKMR